MKTRLACLVIVYVLISCTARATTHITSMVEVFPFFAWSLFSKVPNERNEFAIRIKEFDDETVDPPRFLGSFGPPFGKFSSTGWDILQAWGHAVSSGNEREAEERRKAFELLFLKPKVKNVEYELVKRRYDVLERWESGAVREVKLVAAFSLRTDE